MGKGNITLPPVKKTTDTVPVTADEKKISAVINKGGSPTKQDETSSNAFKNFNLTLLVSELERIHELREKRPRLRGRKRLGISLRDWIIEAIHEKIERESKTYDT